MTEAGTIVVVIGQVITAVAIIANMRSEIRYLRRDIDHAHRRLDKAKIPSAHVEHSL